MDRFLIVDGMNLLFQMFYGMPSRITNSNGFPIHGILGFVGALRKIISRVSPTHIAVIFDGEEHNPRTDISPEYKANRPDLSQLPEEETPFCQLEWIYKSLDIMGISHCETADCEADDLIAGYVRACPDCEIVISSYDSDFFQLISDRVSVLRYRGDKTAILTPADIEARLGIPPSLYVDHKSLTGDSADNIKGAPKIGLKTATLLINQFGSLENILSHAKEISKPSIRKSVVESPDLLMRNYSLIRLEGSDCLPFTLPECIYTPCEMTTREILSAIDIL